MDIAVVWKPFNYRIRIFFVLSFYNTTWGLLFGNDALSAL